MSGPPIPTPPDAPESSASWLSPTSGSTSRPKRPWTILGRLTKAVREQSWFAVVLELVIVVFGVLIAFQVTSWGQNRADRAREQVYLRQLAADLAETERIMADREARLDSTTHYGLSQLLNAYGRAERPPRDSLIVWLSRANAIPSPRPVLGTAEALVASGNLQTVRDDSLRSAILRYLDISRERIADQELWLPTAWESLTWLNNRVNMSGIRQENGGLRNVDFFAIIEFEADTTGSTALPGWVAPFPPDVEGLLDDEDVYEVVLSFWQHMWYIAGGRRTFAESAATLREQVEAELNR